MGIFDFKKLKSAKQDSATTPNNFDFKKKMSSINITRIYEGTSIVGNLTSSDNVYFNGVFVGDINLNNNLGLGEKANLKGNIHALNLFALGNVEGNVDIKKKATFKKTSFFKGDILVKILEIEKGAFFNANLLMPNSFDDSTNIIHSNDEAIVVTEKEVVNTDITSESDSDNDSKAFFSDIFKLK